MKKILLSFICFLVLGTSMETAVALPLSKEPAPVQVVIFKPLNKLSVKEFEQLSGKKPNLFQKLAHKIAQKTATKKAAAGKSQVVALIIALLVGVLGIHRFYLGYTWQGVLQLITFGGLGIWALIDLIRIITGDLKPKNGEYTETL